MQPSIFLRGPLWSLVLLFTHSVSAAGLQDPTINSVEPPPGTVSALREITVTFSEPVTGIGFGDLLLNGVPAIAVSGASATWTFTVEQPPYGPVQVSWDPDHTIFDLEVPPHRFDETAPGATWQYNLVDLTPPTVATLTPAAGVTVRQLTQIEVLFSELVTGVEPGDLLINGTPAGNLKVLGGARYLFSFPQPATGLVQLAWAPGHGIHDFATAANAFAGGAWSYQLDPVFGLPSVRINEFVAANLSGLKDENNEPQDWIELYNYGAGLVSLAGWSLTDDQDDPGRWTFPATNLAPGQYLVVFASGKDRRVPGARLHTNFKLNPSGDYLGLFNAESPRLPVAEFAPEFPEQRNDYSYGFDSTNGLKYFRTPTPGASNGDSPIAGITPSPHANVERGLYDRPFKLMLSCSLPGAAIRFTTDGTEPSDTNGTLYADALSISNTTVLRAAAFAPNLLPSTAITHTYLFLDQVLRQPNNPPGYPAGPTAFTGYPSDYEMDPEIVANPAYAPLLKPALQSLPTLSIVMKVDDMFGATNGIYTHPEPQASQRYLWERPCSVEFILTNGHSGFQVNCGIRIQGNASRTPQKTPKHPFRLLFKGDYGPGRLDYPVFPDCPVNSFDTLVLRADFNNSWVHWDANQRLRGSKIRDAWTKDTFREMGQASGHTRHFHLYINGLYWGVYDFGERIDAEFAASYLGGTAAEYDAIASKPTAAIDGDLIAYNAMMNVVRYRDMRSLTNYTTALQQLDMTNFIDYTLLNFYGANQDWGTDGNWNALRRRAPGETFKYLTWDGEQLIVNPSDNRVTSTDLPSGFHTNLVNSPEYRLAFADRAHKHLFNEGALSTNAVAQRWLKWTAEVDAGIVPESARWGDYRRDVHPYQSGPYYLYTRNDHWLPELDRMLTTYFPQRHAIFLQQLRAAGLYPNVTAPVFSQHGGRVPRGFNLAITTTNAVYFTTNGADPRVFGTGEIAPEAQLYSGPLTLLASTLVRARALSGTNWSALNEAHFSVDLLGVPLRITEIMYNPLGGDAYEFIELQNVGNTPLDLANFSFTGVTYTFPPSSILAPGQLIVLSSSASPAHWDARYPGISVFGRFDGNLSNGGEKLALLDAARNCVVSVDYDDANGWPTAADGLGYSLEIIDPFGNPDDAANWRPSTAINGTPGSLTPSPAPAGIILNELMADNLSAVTNGNTYPDWIELRNTGSQSLDLAGWSLTDDGDPRKFVFPSNSVIAAGGYLVVWCDSLTNTTPGLHTGFGLGRNGETVFLFDTQTSRVDAISFGPQIANYSLGRIEAGWQLTLPTPNAPNQPAALAASTNLVLNEWLANSLPGSADWIELYNPGLAPVSLLGLYVGTSNAISQMTSRSFVPSRGFVQLFADEQAGPDHLDFKLSAAGGVITLYDEAGSALDRVSYGPQLEGVTQGRLPDGSPTITSFPDSPSPRASNYLLAYSGPVLNELLAINDSVVTNAFGHTADWVELFNPNPGAFDLSGMRLSANPANSDQWIFPTNASIPGGGYLLVWFDPDQPPSTNALAALNTGHALDGQSGSVTLFNRFGQPVDQIEYGFQIPDFSIGRVAGQWQLLARPTPGTRNAAPAALGSPADLRINEWMAQPLTGNDWFELYHPGTLPVQLNGLYLSDTPSIVGLTQFPIPPLSFIGPNGFVKIVADADPSDGFDHVSFNLDAQGEMLLIYSSELGVIDTVYFGLQSPGVSQGRLPDGADRIIDFQTPSPAASNFLPISNAVVNEVLTHTDPPLEDAIEIDNPTARSVDLSGWFLSHTSHDFKQYRIPDGTLLPAGGFVVFYETQFNSGLPGSFTLNSAHGDQAYLSAADAAGNLTGERAFASFGAAPNGVSIGRVITSAGVDFVPLAQRTFGMDTPSTQAQFRTGTGRMNAPPAVGPVVINEIMYHPPDIGTNDNVLDEYVELFNFSAQGVPLFDPAYPTNTWRLGEGIAFEFPPNVIIPAAGYLLVVHFDPATDASQLARFRSIYGLSSNVPIFGPFTGKLDNGGETVELYRPDTPQASPHPDPGYVPYVLVDGVAYEDGPPWPVSGDGDGNALQRHTAADYGNEPLNWGAAAPTPGSPNALQPPVAPVILTQPLDRAVPAGTDVMFSVAAYGSGILSHQWRFNGQPINGATNREFWVLGVQAPQAGSYSVVVADGVSSVTSVEATLQLMELPVITAQPQGIVTNAGSILSLSVGVGGQGPWSYQWRRDGQWLAGATNPVLELGKVRVEDSGAYSVVVGNAAGSVASAVASVEIFRGVEILAQPQGSTNNPGSNVTFSVSAMGTGTLRYQWQVNGTNLLGATNASLVLTNVQLEDTGQYTVEVADERGALLSEPASLLVLVRAVVTAQPEGATVAVGTRVSFTVGARGTLPIQYRWRRTGIAVLTNTLYANSCTYTIDPVQTNDGTFYNVAFVNPAGPSTQLSSNAFLTVVVPPTNQIALVGTDVIFGASAYGRARVSYQWQFAGVDLPGATNASLSLTNVQLTNSGEYQVVVNVLTNRTIAPAAFGASLLVAESAPRLREPRVLAGGEFQALVDGPVGQVYELECSTNLVPWVPQAIFRYTNGATPFRDPGAVSPRQRFYRARLSQ